MNMREMKKKIHAAIDEAQPKTHSEISVIVEAIIPARIRWRVCNVEFKGYFQGVQVIIYGRTRTHILPCFSGVYAARPVPNAEVRYVENKN